MQDKNENRPRRSSSPKKNEKANDVKKSFSDKPKAFKRDFDEKKSFDKNDRKPFDKKKSFKNDFEQPKQFKTDERNGSFAKDKKFKKDESFEKKPIVLKKKTDTETIVLKKKKDASSSTERRVGKISKAPQYDFKKIRENLPQKVQKKLNDEPRKTDDSIRLNRYISNAGLCSRRDADELISSGQITVNGNVITEMGYKVKPSDVIKYGKKVLNREKFVYVLLNKPKDFITTTEDPNERKTVMDLLEGACSERIYPVGRLDRNTTGLLLLTNDGELAEKLSHPSNNIKKIYQAELDKPITTEHFEQILSGIELEDGFVKADALGLVTPDAEVVGIEIHSGKNRIVRRIFEHFGYEVKKLDRTAYAGLSKKDLPRGKWRFLTEKELIRLKYLI